MAAAAAALSFADEPVADVKVAELSGNAAVTWGVDLDTGKTGFKNTEEAKLKVNISNEGTKKTEGEGIWAEIEVKGKQLYVKNGGADTGNLKGKVGNDYTNDYGAFKWTSDNASFDGSGGASVEKAQLHFGPVYLGVRSGNTQVGEFKPQNAVRSSNEGIGNVQAPDHSQGIVAGYSSNLFAIDVDFRSAKAATYNWYGNDYGAAAEATLKFVPGLEIKAGADYQFDAKALGVGASAKYTLAMGDTFKLIPSVGYTMGYREDGDNNTADLGMNLAAGVLFSWGAEADANTGVYYLDNDNAKKVTPGVGAVVYINNMTNTANTYVGSTTGPKLVIVPSFYSGEIVPNLTAAALAEIDAPLNGGDVAFAVAGGLKYNLKINDSVTITPQAGVRFNSNTTATSLASLKGKCYGDNGQFDSDAVGTHDKDGNTINTLLNVKIGADVSGLINNTTFSLDWTSRNLTSGKQNEGQVGTINLKCKIAL